MSEEKSPVRLLADRFTDSGLFMINLQDDFVTVGTESFYYDLGKGLKGVIFSINRLDNQLEISYPGLSTVRRANNVDDIFESAISFVNMNPDVEARKRLLTFLQHLNGNEYHFEILENEKISINRGSSRFLLQYTADSWKLFQDENPLLEKPHDELDAVLEFIIAQNT